MKARKVQYSSLVQLVNGSLGSMLGDIFAEHKPRLKQEQLSSKAMMKQKRTAS